MEENIKLRNELLKAAEIIRGLNEALGTTISKGIVRDWLTLLSRPEENGRPRLETIRKVVREMERLVG